MKFKILIISVEMPQERSRLPFDYDSCKDICRLILHAPNIHFVVNAGAWSFEKKIANTTIYQAKFIL